MTPTVKMPLPLLWIGLLGAGCLVPVGSNTGASATATTTTTTVSSSSTSTSGATTTTGTTSTGTSGSSSTDGSAETEGCSFIGCNDGPLPSCDVWAQDCPEGYKCMPWADGGSSAWNALKCTPVGPDLPGEPCTVEGNAVSGVDSCVKGALCWDVDPMTNEGVCFAQCQEPMRMPSCPLGSSCHILADAVVTVCLPGCDPLLQDCPGDDLCLPNGDAFACVLDASGEAGDYGDPCEYANACNPGLHCLPPEYVEGCQAPGCCTPFCDTDKPLICPGASQECLPWYEEGMETPGYEHVGICGVPQ